MKKYLVLLTVLFLFITCYQNWNKTKNFGNGQGEFVIYADNYGTNEDYSNSNNTWNPPSDFNNNNSDIKPNNGNNNSQTDDFNNPTEDNSKSLLGVKITLNPGHHATGGGIAEKEYNGPRYKLKGILSNMKAGATSGTSSCINGEAEGIRTLRISTIVMNKLVEKGAEVTLLDTSTNRYTNKQRAIIANTNGSELAVSLHYDSNDDSTVRGSSVLVLAKNKGLYQNGDTQDNKDWNTTYDNIIDQSNKIASYYQQIISSDSNYKVPYRAISYRTDLTGLNWTTIPTFYIELGFMSNPDDDKWLMENEDMVADKIVVAIEKYFKAKE